MNKKVSIILPVYNGEKYIAESIESIIRQSYKNWELIIVNDCSNDRTLEICDGFAEKDCRIKVVSNAVNQKLPTTLNNGFKLATGEYYTWTSDDNIYNERAIEELVDTLDKNQDAVMVYSDYMNIDENGNPMEKVSLNEPEIIVLGNVCGACFLYTAEAAKRVGDYDANLFLAEDYDYWIRVFRCGKIIHLKKELYYYRQHGGSLTETKKDRIKNQTYKAIEKNFLWLYAEAKRNKLKNEFLDRIFVWGAQNKEELEELIKTIDSGYKYRLYVRLMKQIIEDRIKSSHIYKLAKRKGQK